MTQNCKLEKKAQRRVKKNVNERKISLCSTTILIDYKSTIKAEGMQKKPGGQEDFQ